MLLDEATSALDVETEERVLRNIIRQRPNKTCIVSTHRPSVLDMCQRIYRVVDGRITELEKTDELLRSFQDETGRKKMKINQDFIMRDVAGEKVVVPVGAAAELNALITSERDGGLLCGSVCRKSGRRKKCGRWCWRRMMWMRKLHRETWRRSWERAASAEDAGGVGL